MFKDITNPKVDEAFRFAIITVSAVFLTVIIAISYELAQWI